MVMKSNVSVHPLYQMKVLCARIWLPAHFIAEITEHISIKLGIEGLHQKLSSEFSVASCWSCIRVAQYNLLRVAEIEICRFSEKNLS